MGAAVWVALSRAWPRRRFLLTPTEPEEADLAREGGEDDFEVWVDVVRMLGEAWSCAS